MLQFSDVCVWWCLYLQACCVCVHVNCPACCKYYRASCVESFLLYVFKSPVHMCLCIGVCVCVPLQLSVYPATTPGSLRPPVLPARCGCAHLFLSLCLCVWVRETDRTLLWAPCCHWGKPIMGHARVSGTPPTNIIQTHSFPFICMDARAQLHLFCFLLPSGEWAKCFLHSLIWN